jgi:hypothetical protein
MIQFGRAVWRDTMVMRMTRPVPRSGQRKTVTVQRDAKTL